MTRGVKEEIAVEGGEELGVAEVGDARAAEMAHARFRDHNERLARRESWRSEPGAEPSAEIHVLPPGGHEPGVEAAQRLPDRAPDEPCGGRRLGDGGGKVRRSGECRRAGKTESEPGNGGKTA